MTREVAAGPVLIADLPERGLTVTGGFVEYVRIPAATEHPRYYACIVDRPAPPGGRKISVPTLMLMWHGRGRVPGIAPGVWVRVRGSVSRVKGQATMYDPHYEILASHRELVSNPG